MITGIVSDVNGMRLTKSYSCDGIECFAGGFKVATDKKLMATLQVRILFYFNLLSIKYIFELS